MNLKRTLTLFGVLIAMLWIFGIIVESRKGAAESEYLFPKLQKFAPKITTVEVKKGEGTYTFKKQDDGSWTLNEPGSDVSYRVATSKVEQLISQVRSATKVEDTDFTQNKATEKLDDPPVTVKIASPDSSWTLKLGKQSGDEKFVAVISSERPNRIYAMEAASIDEALTENMRTFRDTTLLDVTSKNSQYLSIVERGGKQPDEFVVDYDKTEDLWRFKKPKNFGVADVSGGKKDKTSRPGLASLLDAVGKIRVTDPKYFEDKASLIERGKEAFRITVAYEEGKGFDAKKRLVKRTLLVGPELKKSKRRYVRLVGDEYVATISSDVMKPIIEAVNNPELYRSRDLVFPTPTKAKGMELADGEKKSIQLLKGGMEAWTVRAKGMKESAPADTKVVNDLLEALHGDNKIKYFLKQKDKDAAFGWDQPKQLPRVDIYFSGVTQDPKNPKLTATKPDVSLLFGRQEGDVVYVKRTRGSGEVDRFAYPLEILDKLKLDQGYLAYLKRELSPLQEDEIAKITIDQSGREVVIERKAAGWKMLKPKNLPKRGPDPFQVAELIRTLSGLDVVEWHAPIDKETKVSEYGLGRGSFNIKVEFKGSDKKKLKTRVYEFGSTQTKGTKGVFARVSGTDTVFLAKSSTVDDLRTMELRDRTVLGMDPSKIREVVLRDWESQGLHFVLKATRESATASWTAKSKSARATQLESLPFAPLNDLASAKLDAFLQRLSSMKAERFLEESGGMRRDQKQPDGEYSLVVDVKVAGEKKGELQTYTLHIGRQNPKETGYYAELKTVPSSINPLPGVVLLLPKLPWEDILKNQLNYFVKK